MSLFTPWLPMYDKRAHPERPWWKSTVWVKFNGGILQNADGSMPFVGPGYDYVQGWARCDGALSDVPALHDAQHPLPGPAAMPGQVWVWSEKDQATVVDIRDGCPVWNGGVIPNPYHEAVRALIDKRFAEARAKEMIQNAILGNGVCYTSGLYLRDIRPIDYTWPPPEAVLVAGPSCYGPNPWAPVGWTP